MSSNKLVHSVTANTVSTNSLNVAGHFTMKGVTVISPEESGRVTIQVVSPGVIIAPSGPIGEVTVIFPSQPADGQVVYVSITQPAKAVRFTNGVFANASTLSSPVAAGASITLFFHAATRKWYKLGGGSAV
jgi:hypothetical protein